MAVRANEKERVYGELDFLRRKCGRLKREVNNLKAANAAHTNAALRTEVSHYRKALSNIAYRLDHGGVDDETLRSIVEAALVLRGLRARDRREIARAHGAEGEPS